MAFKREIQGVVVKTTGEKTASILVERRVVYPRYRKIIKCFKKYLIHDERNEAKVSDTVVAAECRLFLERKSSRLKSILAIGVE